MRDGWSDELLSGSGANPDEAFRSSLRRVLGAWDQGAPLRRSGRSPLATLGGRDGGCGRGGGWHRAA